MTNLKYPLLVFDWDGTLMNSISHIVDSLLHAMRETGEQELTRDKAGDIIGLGLREAIIALFPHRADDEEFVAKYAQSYRDYYMDPKHRTELFEGAHDTLLQLKDEGYILTVATGKGRHGLDYVFEQTGLGHLFATSQCADETQSKPHPAMIQAVLKDTGHKPEQGLMIGDTEFDLEMASNAGMASIGVSYGVHDEQRLQKHNPVGIIEQISHLPSLLKSL